MITWSIESTSDRQSHVTGSGSWSVPNIKRLTQ